MYLTMGGLTIKIYKVDEDCVFFREIKKDKEEKQFIVATHDHFDTQIRQHATGSRISNIITIKDDTRLIWKSKG